MPMTRAHAEPNVRTIVVTIPRMMPTPFPVIPATGIPVVVVAPMPTQVASVLMPSTGVVATMVPVAATVVVDLVPEESAHHPITFVVSVCLR